DGASASPALADEALRRGDATMVLTIPRAFESTLVRTGAAPIELAVNAEKGSAAGIVQAYASSVASRYASELDAMRGVGWDARSGRQARIAVRTRNWYNATLDYRQYMVPGILVALVTLVGTLLTAQNIAREKELGTLEQLNVTPITRG